MPLSDTEVLGKSLVQFEEPVTSFTQLVDKQGFTIYEGVWGDYYAARIEVWFMDTTTGKERKLLEKVYRVEGWQR